MANTMGIIQKHESKKITTEYLQHLLKSHENKLPCPS